MEELTSCNQCCWLAALTNQALHQALHWHAYLLARLKSVFEKKSRREKDNGGIGWRRGDRELVEEDQCTLLSKLEDVIDCCTSHPPCVAVRLRSA